MTRNVKVKKDDKKKSKNGGNSKQVDRRVEDAFDGSEWNARRDVIYSGKSSLMEVYKMEKGDLLGKGKFVELWKAIPHDGSRQNERARVCLFIVQAGNSKKFSKYANLVNKKFAGIPKHYNLVQCRNWEGPDALNRLWRVTEYFSGGSVKDMRNCGMLAEHHIAHALHCTLKALAHLHKHGVVHGSVCTSNLLLSDTFEVKLGDLCVSDRFVPMSKDAKIDSELTINGLVKNPEFLPPEAFSGIPVESSFDIWAVGISALELAYGDPPHHHKKYEYIASRRTKGEPPFLEKRKKSVSEVKESEWTEEYCDFIRCCLIKNFKMRPSATTLLQHDFLKVRNWNSMNGRSSGSHLLHDPNLEASSNLEETDRTGHARTASVDKYAYVREMHQQHLKYKREEFI
eukprot:CAMPEP_0114509562 /NCGR_PEP_ID=MMETSP0109-20121206/13281_1 /TAXON_ID=29199 /ORGANISM="Chlorarachnion reptans, Strain CCCM449" /LENGTH=399 /DNA_ID=CAMNT_0001688733 /DNA_START=170 /DNA_END=1369 /DNA_ORIENTATION=+